MTTGRGLSASRLGAAGVNNMIELALVYIATTVLVINWAAYYSYVIDLILVIQ